MSHRHWHGGLRERQQRPVHPPKSLEFPRDLGNESRSRRRLGRGRVMETRQPGRQRRRRGRRALPLAPPPGLQRATFGSRQQILLDRPKNRRKLAVALQPLDVVNAIAAGQVQQHHRQNHLDVQPALASRHANMPLDRRPQPTGLHQIEIDRKTGQRRQPMARRIALVLEIKHALCQHPRTPVVMVCESQTKTISLIPQGQRGTSIS